MIQLTSINSHHTANAAVSLHHALSVGVTWAGLTVGAKPGTMATSHLVTCEASFTLSAAEGALVRTVQSQKRPTKRECDNNHTYSSSGGLTIVL